MSNKEPFTFGKSSADQYHLEDMAPLGTTAEVPAIHSDKMNDPNSKLQGETVVVLTEHRDVKERPSRTKKVLAGVIGGAVLVGGGITAAVTYGGGNDKSTASAPATPDQTNKKEVLTQDSNIEDVNTKATPEQVLFVMENPVNIAEYPTIDRQVSAIGDRWTIMLNSGEIDFKKTSGDASITPVFTPESEEQLVTMLDTVFETDDPVYYNDMVDGIKKTKGQHVAMFLGTPGAEVKQNWVLIGDPQAAGDNSGSIVVNVNILNDSNQPDDKTSDGEYNDDLNVDLTLRTDEAGVVKIVSINNAVDIGNIG